MIELVCLWFVFIYRRLRSIKSNTMVLLKKSSTLERQVEAEGVTGRGCQTEIYHRSRQMHQSPAKNVESGPLIN